MEEKKCSCKKNITGGPRDIRFKYKGFSFEIFKHGFICKECAKKRFIKLLDDYILKSHSKLIQREDSELKIDWKLYCELTTGIRSGTYSEQREYAIDDVLLSLKIFSFSSRGNYDIVDSVGIRLTPSAGVAGSFYFMRRQDAIDYAKAKLQNTMYGWSIRQIGEVIISSEVKKM